VANHPSAEKRNRQRIKRTNRNRTVKSEVRSVVKNANASLAGKDAAAAKKAVDEATSTLAKAAAKGVVHKKAAARRIGRLAKKAHKVAAAK
jgi:small subunit ribosomal protein S20